MVRTTEPDDRTEPVNDADDKTHRIHKSDLSVGDAVRLSHADVVVTRLEPFDRDETPNAPAISAEDEFGYLRLSNGSIEEGHVGGVAVARTAEAVAFGDWFDFDGGTIPDECIDLRAGFVTCDKCGDAVDDTDDPWASFSVSPHGSNDRDDSFAVSVCGSCAREAVEALGRDGDTVDRGSDE